MKWRNHNLTTLATVYAATGSFPAMLIASAASHMPDALEFSGIVGHRTVTHYPWFYLVPAVFLWCRLHNEPGYVAYIVFLVLVGCLCHLFEDLLSNSGIPLVTPYGKPYGLHLYVTRTPSEFTTALAIVFSALLIAWNLGRLDGEYIRHAALQTQLFVQSLIRSVIDQGVT